MPLSAVEFVPREYYDLMTGAMADQPVTLSNTLSVGGDQRHDAAGLRVYGSIDLYASRADDTPGFRVGPNGFVWPEALTVPSLNVVGDLTVSGTISGNLPFDKYITPYLRELHPGVLIIGRALVVGGADPWGTGLLNGQAQLVVRGPDLVAHGGSSIVSMQCWSGNWLQFNVRFWDLDPDNGWLGKAMTLDFDVDNLTPGTAGRITIQGGKVGIGRILDVEKAIRDLQMLIV